MADRQRLTGPIGAVSQLVEPGKNAISRRDAWAESNQARDDEENEGTKVDEERTGRQVGARGEFIGRKATTKRRAGFRSGDGGKHEHVERAAP